MLTDSCHRSSEKSGTLSKWLISNGWLGENRTSVTSKQFDRCNVSKLMSCWKHFHERFLIPNGKTWLDNIITAKRAKKGWSNHSVWHYLCTLLLTVYNNNNNHSLCIKSRCAWKCLQVLTLQLFCLNINDFYNNIVLA